MCYHYIIKNINFDVFYCHMNSLTNQGQKKYSSYQRFPVPSGGADSPEKYMNKEEISYEGI